MPRGQYARKPGHLHPDGCECRICVARTRKTQTITRPDRVAAALETATPENPVIVEDYGGPKGTVAAWFTMRAVDPKLTMAECSRRLGLNKEAVQQALKRARKEGWLKIVDPIERIEREIIPKTLDNINYFLDKKDRLVTIETAKATAYRAYQEAKGISNTSRTILALKIEAAPPHLQISSAKVVGVPRFVEGETVVEGQDSQHALQPGAGEVRTGNTPLGLPLRSEGQESRPDDRDPPIREVESEGESRVRSLPLDDGFEER